MGKLRQTALILGEGPTEFFYFKSLCDVFKRLTIKPDYPKHTNIKELEVNLLFPLHLTSIRRARAIAQRSEPICGVSEDGRVLHQNQRTTQLL